MEKRKSLEAVRTLVRSKSTWSVVLAAATALGGWFARGEVSFSYQNGKASTGAEEAKDSKEDAGASKIEESLRKLDTLVQKTRADQVSGTQAVRIEMYELWRALLLTRACPSVVDSCPAVERFDKAVRQGSAHAIAYDNALDLSRPPGR